MKTIVTGLLEAYALHADDVVFGSNTVSDLVGLSPLVVFVVAGFVYCLVKKIEVF